MPDETPGAKLPSPWKDLLGGIDKALEKPLAIHCIGGFALVYYYGIPRTTGDIDYYTAVPADLNLEEIAGHDSDLHRRYKVYLHRVTVATLPEEYEERLSEMASGQFERLRLIFGLVAVTAMLVSYALEKRNHWFILAFAGSCASGSAHGFLQDAWPFGRVEAIWALVALQRWRTAAFPAT